MVEGDDFAREFCDVSAWHWGDYRSQTNALCTHRHRCQRDPGVHSWFYILESVPDEKAVPAGLFCLMRKISEYGCVSAEVNVRRVESESHARESTGSRSRLTCRNVVASLPLESPDNEGLYKA